MGLNDQLASRYTQHAVDVSKYTADVRKRVLRELAQLQKDLEKSLKNIDPLGGKGTYYQQARLEKLLAQTKATINGTFKQINSDMNSRLTDFAKIESKFVPDAINALAGIELASVAVSPAQLKAIVSDLVIEGGPAKDWWASQALNLQSKFARSVRSGMLQGSTNDQIIGDISQFMDVSARDAEALVRTSVQTVSNAARLDSIQANDDVVGLIQQRSTLDSRTTDICKAYAGLTWTNDAEHTPVGHALPFNSGPPRHWNCRSTLVPVVKSWEDLGQDVKLKTGGRPTDDPEAYFRSRLEAQGVPADRIDKVLYKAQAALDGQVPEDWDYETWLESKPEAFQREVLGDAKWELWNADKISFRDLVDHNGEPITLEELQARAARH